jgi:hypothetical protein
LPQDKCYKLLYSTDGQLTSLPDHHATGIEFVYRPGVLYDAPETGPFFALASKEAAVAVARFVPVSELPRVGIWECVGERVEMYIGVYKIPAPDILDRKLAIAFWKSIEKVAPKIIKSTTPKLDSEGEQEPCLTIEFELLYQYYQKKEMAYLHRFNRSPFISTSPETIFLSKIKLERKVM